MDERLTVLNEWLCSRHGIVTRQALLGMDFSRGSISSLVRSQRLVQVWAGVYRSAAVSFERSQIMSAICQQYPRAAIAFTTAGRQWGYRLMRDARIHVLVPHAMTPTVPGVVVHRCRRIDPVDIAGRREDGIQLTSPPRTLFDCAAILDEDSIASVIEQAIAERRCNMDTLFSTMVRLRHGRRPGSLRFEAVLLSRPVLRGAARSTLERDVRSAIRAAGLPDPLVNHPVRLSSGQTYVVDVAWPEQMVALEVDHPFWHDREMEAANDKLRDRKLAANGWLPQRLSKVDVETRLDDALTDVRDVLVLRGWASHAAV